MGIGDWGLGIGDWAQSPIPTSIQYYISFLYYISQLIPYSLYIQYTFLLLSSSLISRKIKMNLCSLFSQDEKYLEIDDFIYQNQ